MSYLLRPFLGACVGGALLLAPLSLSAKAPSVEEVLEQMEKVETSLEGFSFDFRQTAVIHVTEEKEVIEGQAAFKRPDHFRLEHTSPRPQTIVSDGQTLWVYSPVREQVLIENWKSWTENAGLPKGLIPFQMNTADLQSRFDIVVDREDKSKKRRGAVLKLTPKEGTPWPYTFLIWVSLQDGLPYRTELQARSVTAVTEVFNTSVNPDFAQDHFHLQVPEGTQRIGMPFTPHGDSQEQE